MLDKYKNTCQFITKEYYSNCIIEALKAKIKNRKVKLYFCPPYRKKTGKIASMHVVWEDENFSYDFSDLDWSDNGHWWQCFWYKGLVRRWPKEFAKDYFAFRKMRSDTK